MKPRGTTLLSLFLLFLILSYFIFLEVLPPIRLAFVFAAYLIVAFIVWGFSIIRTQKIKMPSPTEAIGWATLFFMLVVALLAYSDFRGSVDEGLYFSTVASSLVIPAFLWLTGLCLAKEEANAHKKYFLFPAVFLGLISIIIIGSYLNYRTTGNPIFLAHVSAEQKANHLLIADTLAITALLYSQIVRKRDLFSTWFGFLLIILLFLAGSRTTLYIICALFLLSVVLLKKWKLAIVLLLIVAILPLVEIKTSLTSEPEVERMLVLKNLEEDSSWQARKELRDVGWGQLKDSWLFGEFMAEVRSGLGKGTYAHNWISYWVSYGLVTFFLFAVLTVLLLIKSISIWLARGQITSLLLVLFVLGAIIYSRGYLWPLPWLAYGYIVRICYPTLGQSYKPCMMIAK